MKENVLQRLIITTLEQAGYLVVRIHAGRLKFNGSWLRLAPEGFPDLLVVGHCLLEVKADGGELSDAQKRMHGSIRRVGGRVATVRSVAEALAAVKGGTGG
jgi:hypothetical protein